MPQFQIDVYQYKDWQQTACHWLQYCRQKHTFFSDLNSACETAVSTAELFFFAEVKKDLYGMSLGCIKEIVRMTLSRHDWQAYMKTILSATSRSPEVQMITSLSELLESLMSFDILMI